MTHKAQIQLEYVKFTNVSLKENDYNSNIEEIDVKYKLEIANGFNKSVSTKNFGVRINMQIETNNGLNINIESHSSFSTNLDITDEFIKGNFPKINAPAIVYPFIRAFVSNLTVNSGYKSIILPAINFQKLTEEKEAKA